MTHLTETEAEKVGAYSARPKDFLKRERRASPTKEKGGPPEDARQEVCQMQHVMDVDVKGKKPTPIRSENSPDMNASIWLNAKIDEAKIKIVSEVVELTPALARVLLARNPDNRKISATIVENYARDMSNGSWAFNGEPIIVSSDGKLNDGQHRCEAVISSGATVTTVLIVGPDRSSRLTVDQGKIRVVADYLGMNGLVDATSLGAMVNFIWQHQNHGMISQTPSFRPTKSEILAFVDQHPNVVESLSRTPSTGVNAVGGRAMIAYIHWLLTKAGGRDAAELFLDALVKGSNLVPRSPILYARNRLMNERGRLNPNEKAELLIRAWNASRRGDKVASLPIKGGPLPDVER